ncbi:MAG: methionyl-tRNA formyltransferase [Parcubacteria group bacterium]|jgi:methionyl-tRNA formyltransferase
MENKKKPTIVFMGTPDIASIVLESLCLENYPILAVVTQPDYISKNKKEALVSPVKRMALEKNIPIIQPDKLDNEFKEWLEKIKPDLLIVVAFGKIIPKKILDIPKFKSLNIHASMLPKLRGASPIQNALANGMAETGITVMLMDEGIDTGDILSQKSVAIDPQDNYLTLTGKLAVTASSLLLKTIPSWIEGTSSPQKQDHSQATMCQLIEKSDGQISWSENADEIYNKFRAFHVWPGIFTFWENKENLQKLSLNEISVQKNKLGEKHHLGEVFQYTPSQIGVQTNSGVIILDKIQLAGKNETLIDDFLNGYPNFIGSILK